MVTECPRIPHPSRYLRHLGPGPGGCSVTIADQRCFAKGLPGQESTVLLTTLSGKPGSEEIDLAFEGGFPVPNGRPIAQDARICELPKGRSDPE